MANDIAIKEQNGLKRSDLMSISGECNNDAAGHRTFMEAWKKLKNMDGLNILNEMSGVAATKVAQNTYNQPNDPAAYLVEQRRGSESSRYIDNTGDWSVQVVIKENNAGKELTRYRLKNVSKGQTFAQDFKYEAVASLVMACLNETGKQSDPRIKRIVELCEQENELIREINNDKRVLKTVPEGNIKRRAVLENQLELNRLKLENIRLKLGI